MGPVPSVPFHPEDWPQPQEDGSTILGAAASGKLLVTLTAMIGYIEEQYAACQKAASSPIADH